MPVVSHCPSAAAWQHLLGGQISPENLEPCLRHLEQCPRCTGVVQALPGIDTGRQVSPGQDIASLGPEGALVEKLMARLAGQWPTAGGGATTAATAPAGAVAGNYLAMLSPARTGDELGWLGSYRVLRVLGSGGMGVVFQAEDSQLGRSVALKVLKPELAADADYRQRFVREARMAAALQHDHVVTIYHVSEEGGVPLLAMQLLEGESLEQCLQREGKLPLAEVVRIGREIAVGLQAAHRRGLIHRDIKPANLWLEKDTGRVKILDFGLARPTAADDAQLTRAGMILGTPAYMAPEQSEGRPLDARCDLFSLGCVLYRLATGVPPFQGLTPLAVMKAVTSVEPRPAKVVNSEVPPALSELIQRLLAKNPSDRPATAQGVVDMLATLERNPRIAGRRAAPRGTGSPLLLHPEAPFPGRQGTPAPVRRRLLLGLAAACLVAVMVGGGLLLSGWVAPTPEVTQKTDDEKKAEEKKAAEQKDATTSVGLPMNFAALVSAPAQIKGLKSWNIEANDAASIGRLAYSPDGRSLYLQGGNFEGSWDFTKGVLVKPAAFVPPSSDLITSPDGKRHARPKGNTVELFKAGDKEPYRTVRGLSAVEDLLFSPDSKWLVISAGADGVLAVDPGSGVIAKRLRGDNAGDLFLGWLADGKTLLAANRVSSQVFLLDIAAEKAVKTSKDGYVFNGYQKWSALSPDGKLLARPLLPNGFVVFDPVSEKEIHKSADTPQPTVVGYALCIWSPDSKRLVYRAKDNALRILEAATGKVKEWRGPAKEIHNFAFAPDSKTFASFGADNTIRLWSATNGQHLGSIVLLPEGHWLAVSPEGHYKTSKGGEKAIVFIAETPDGDTRELSPAEFAKRYGWQNQPERVQLTEAARNRLVVEPPVEKK